MMPEMPFIGDRRRLGAVRNTWSQAFEFRAKIDSVWR
jgi:hypothetical protein